MEYRSVARICRESPLTNSIPHKLPRPGADQRAAPPALAASAAPLRGLGVLLGPGAGPWRGVGRRPALQVVAVAYLPVR